MTTRLAAIRERFQNANGSYAEVLHDRDWLLARVTELTEALGTMSARIADGTLVRDISRDHEPGWAMRQLPLVLLLKRTELVLAALDATEEPPR